MASEPKRPIEELLQRAAEARRAEFGAEPSMPNLTRARLHEELVRQNRTTERAPRVSWLVRYWPRLSALTAAALVVLVAGAVWMKSHNAGRGNVQLAMQSAPQELPAVAADRASKPDEPIALAQAEASRDEAVATQEFASAPAAAAPASARAESAPVGVGLTSNRPQVASKARGQTLRNQAKLSQSSPVLHNFQLEQNGQQIRLVDADGSTYSGQIVHLKPAAAARAKSASLSPAPEGLGEAVGAVSFRASGYNSTLQKRIVFEGSYLPAAPNESSSVAVPGQPPTQASSGPRVIGTAQIAGEAPVAVDATAVPP